MLPYGPAKLYYGLVEKTGYKLQVAGCRVQVAQ